MPKPPTLRPPPRIEPAGPRLDRPAPAERRRRPRLQTVALIAVLALALVGVFVVLPRWVADRQPKNGPPESTRIEPTPAPTPRPLAEASPEPAADEGVRRTVERALEEGSAALAEGDPERAASAFRRAAALEPGNTAAEEGLRRSDNLLELRKLEIAAIGHEQRGETSRAVAAARRALELDPGNEKARGVIDRVQRATAENTYETLITRGLQALEDEDFDAALSAFSAASKLRPSAPEVADGLARTRAGMRHRSMLAELARAEQAETDEDWSAAIDAYRAALDLEPALAAARNGLSQSEERQRLTQRINFHLDNPERLSSAEVLTEATDLVDEASRATPRGPRIDKLTTDLARLVARSSIPIAVALQSDGLTEVVVYKVGALGSFEHHTLELRPGRYTAVGRRPGYRDVRLTIEIRPGVSPPPVMIRCTEGI